MRRELREAYDRELALLRERAHEFALTYPGIADRLGGLLQDNLDPAVAGLLEGTALLAARVQVRLDESFRDFTRALLDQLYPAALAPTPSVMLVRARPPLEDAELVKGLRFARGSYLDARYTVGDRRLTCRFRLCSNLTLWPIAVTGAQYHSAPGRLAALGLDVSPGTRAGIEIELARLDPSGEVGGALSDLELDDLPIHFTAPLSEAAALYEQVTAPQARLALRWLDAQGDPAILPLPRTALEPLGFGSEERIFSQDARQFDGFALLREAFLFPRKFLGVRLRGLRAALARVPASRVQLLIELPVAHPVLAVRFDAGGLHLHAAPAVNLFEDRAAIRLDAKRHDYVVTPHSSPLVQYEVHAVTDVLASYKGHEDKVRALPLYAPPPRGQTSRTLLHYAIQRRPRRLTEAERRFGVPQIRYLGTETFLSLYEPPEAEPAERLHLTLVCSNRHLPEFLPIGLGRDDFQMVDNQAVQLACISGPTPPSDALVLPEERGRRPGELGDGHWRLISYLSLSRHGIEGRSDGQDAAAALREMLLLFADRSDPVIAAQINSIRSMTIRPVVRTLHRSDGHFAARGLEVSITCDEQSVDGSTLVLLGAVIDRFLAEYSAINSFTQCRMLSEQRGLLRVWPPRLGRGPLL